jgi:hypothetical protein
MNGSGGSLNSRGKGLDASLSTEGCGLGHTPVPDVTAGADEGLRMKMLSELDADLGDSVSAERVGTDVSLNLGSTGMRHPMNGDQS